MRPASPLLRMRTRETPGLTCPLLALVVHVRPSVSRLLVYPILAYCGSSIAMTVINKYCVSGAGFSMNFLLLAIQSVVALIAVVIAKRAGIITFRDFDVADAKAWFPISALLVAVIYTGSKSLVSRPVAESRSAIDASPAGVRPRSRRPSAFMRSVGSCCPLFFLFTLLSIPGLTPLFSLIARSLDPRLHRPQERRHYSHRASCRFAFWLPSLIVDAYPPPRTWSALQAYGEVIWFGGHVTSLALCSFLLMVSLLAQFLSQLDTN